MWSEGMHILYLAVNRDDEQMQTNLLSDFQRMRKLEILF